MKANYLPKSRPRNRHLRRIIILIVIFVLGVVLFSNIDGFLIKIFSPIWKQESTLARNFKNLTALFGSQVGLWRENTALKERAASLELELLSLKGGQAQENVLLEFIERGAGAEAIVAAVLTRPPQTPYDIIVIDAGSNDGVSIGNRVTLPEGPVLGVISELFTGNSKVKLFSADGEEIQAILEREGLPITLTGVGAGNFRIVVPQDTPVEVGDRILSSGSSSRLLAVVGEIESKSTDSFKKILAKSPTNIFSLRFVFVTP